MINNNDDNSTTVNHTNTNDIELYNLCIIYIYIDSIGFYVQEID